MGDREPAGFKDQPEVDAFLRIAHEHYGRRAPEPPGVVLELGSRAEEGRSPRYAWPKAEWVGVDWREGPGVDIVGLVDALHKEDKLPGADLVLSVCALEHDPRWPGTIRAAVTQVAPGGIVALCWSGPGWPAHDVGCAPAGATPDIGAGTWFRPLSVAEVLANLSIHAYREGRDVRWAAAWYEARASGGPGALACVVAQVGPPGVA